MSAANSAKPILVVEDDVDIADAMVELLKLEGFPVLVATEGKQALEILKTKGVSAVFLDWMMPGMNGASFLQALREQSEFANLPVIVLTADVRVRETSRTMGIAGFLSKPFNADDLIGLAKRFSVPPERASASSLG